jgi:hypothetical protein
MNEAFCSIDWVKVAHVFQALLTPVIGVATVVIGVIAVLIQRQQAATNRLQYRLALFERRMKVFNTTLDFLAGVVEHGAVSLDQTTSLLRGTREHDLLFGPEIDQYIEGELYKKGVELEMQIALGAQGQARRAELLQWFSGQFKVAEEKFLKYIDFREP